MSVQPNAHPQLFKGVEHLIHVCHGCEMQFERLLSLNHGVVAWFAYLHDLGFQPTLKNPGNVCFGNTVSIQPYANPL